MPEGTLDELDDLLRKLSDELLSKENRELEFLDGVTDLQESLRLDLAAAEKCMQEGHWKPATVMAGSVIEALLLWRVGRLSNEERDTAILTARNDKRMESLQDEDKENTDVFSLRAKPNKDLKSWDFRTLLVVAHLAGAFDSRVAISLNLGRNYRNLIHPGREERKSEKCTRGTAFIALGAARRLIESLGAKNARQSGPDQSS